MIEGNGIYRKKPPWVKKSRRKAIVITPGGLRKAHLNLHVGQAMPPQTGARDWLVTKFPLSEGWQVMALGASSSLIKGFLWPCVHRLFSRWGFRQLQQCGNPRTTNIPTPVSIHLVTMVPILYPSPSLFNSAHPHNIERGPLGSQCILTPRSVHCKTLFASSQYTWLPDPCVH